VVKPLPPLVLKVGAICVQRLHDLYRALPWVGLAFHVLHSFQNTRKQDVPLCVRSRRKANGIYSE